MYLGLHVKYPLFLADINETWNYLDRFSKNTQISNFIKMRPVGAELFNEDGRTGRHDKGNSRSPKINFGVFFCRSHNKQRLLIVFITEKECVYCAVRTKHLRIIEVSFRL
jgi:hypothetical protein